MGRSLMCWGWSCGMLGRERGIGFGLDGKELGLRCLEWISGRADRLGSRACHPTVHQVDDSNLALKTPSATNRRHGASSGPLPTKGRVARETRPIRNDIQRYTTFWQKQPADLPPMHMRKRRRNIKPTNNNKAEAARLTTTTSHTRRESDSHKHPHLQDPQPGVWEEGRSREKLHPSQCDSNTEK